MNKLVIIVVLSVFAATEGRKHYLEIRVRQFNKIKTTKQNDFNLIYGFFFLISG